MAGKLINISAPSGSGKSTIINYLLTKGLNLAFSVSATSNHQVQKKMVRIVFSLQMSSEKRLQTMNSGYEEVLSKFYGH